jgi:polyisoprenoid-binding protein YceI
MFASLGIGAVVVAAGVVLFIDTQRNDDSAVGKRAAPPPSASAAPVAGTTRMTVADTGSSTFLIDAPLEKIKGRWTKFRGQLDVDPSDLRKTTGEVDLDLDDLKTETFDDADKNATQTGHTHNWLGLGTDVPTQERDDNRWARFTITAIDDAAPGAVGDAPESANGRVVRIVAHGDMWLHGVTSPKTVKLTATFSGPPSSPSSVHITTDAPILISLKEHDVKPRDVTGKFLNGALEKVGKKIDDTVQVSLDVTANAGVVASTH